MNDCMTFPDTVEEFMGQYKIVDTDGIYMSKGAELVPIFRMRQWFEHLPSAQPVIRCKDCYYYLNSSEKCALIDTRLQFYLTDNIWSGDSFCSWAKTKTE